MTDEHSCLRFFPVALFSTVMGLAGFAIAVQRAEEILGLPGASGEVLAWVAAVVFVTVAVGYGLKVLRYPGEVAAELNHPIKLSFFPTISISLVLLSVAFRPGHETASYVLMMLGAPMQLGFTLFVMSRWISHSVFEIHHSNPSWFIPVVGNILVPVAATAHGMMEASWFFYSVGLVFWLVLLTIIVNRMIFHHPMPEKLAPTLFILIAPPAVGFISYVKLSGGLDGFGRVLFYTALFTVLLVVALYGSFRGIRFYLSWWAFSFPTAAFTIASMLMFRLTGLAFFLVLSWLMLALLAGIVVLLLGKTWKAIGRGEICVAE